MRLALALVLAVVSTSAPSGEAFASGRATAALRLDDVPFRPELAMTPRQRSIGLMHRSEAPKDGMLFVFPEPTTGAFWMKNTLVPLTIVFFDSEGRQVRKLSMTPCTQDPCRFYNPRRRYQFALELPATDTRCAATIGPLASLRRLTRLAR